MKYIKLDSGLVLEMSNDNNSWPESERLSVTEGRRLLREEALKSLTKALKAGDTVYSVLRNVSRSGMSRQIDFYVIGKDRKPWCISGLIRHVSGYACTESGALKVNGCGMDMGFHVVNNLSMTLFCPDKYTHDGAYALNHAWL
jgi:hypothetical protein